MDLIYDANTSLKIFNMNDAQKFKFDMLEKYPEAKFCALSVTLKGTQYEILQIMLDANLNPIKKNNFIAVGRQLMAEGIAENVVTFLGGKIYKLME